MTVLPYIPQIEAETAFSVLQLYFCSSVQMLLMLSLICINVGCVAGLGLA